MIGINQEIRNRIRLSIAAYAYEMEDNYIIDDFEFDELSRSINPKEKTGNRKLDNFFKKYFNPDTGMWIRQHPELDKIAYLYKTYYANK
jgi:hypothetical protein